MRSVTDQEALINKAKGNMDIAKHIVEQSALSDAEDHEDIYYVIETGNSKYYFGLDTLVRDKIMDGIEDYFKANLDESKNPLKDAEEFAKKHQKGLGAFVKLNAGNVEKGMETFNKNMSDSASTGEAQGMGEKMNIREELNKIDMDTCETDLVNMYEACTLTNEDKKQLVTLLKENKIEDLNKFLESKLFEDTDSNTSVRDALKLLVDKFGNNKHKYKATADSFYDGSGWEGDIREFTFFAPNDYIAAFSLVLHQAPTIANFEAAEITGDDILNYMNQFESADDIAYELGTDGLAGNEDIIIDLTNITTGNNLFQHDTEDSYDSDEYDDYDWDDDMDESLYEAEDDYSEEDLKMFANMIRVNSPQFRGDSYPPFAETKINESNIPDNMRFKIWDTEVTGADTIEFTWITQEEFTNEDSEVFIKEIKRAINALIDSSRFDQPFTLALEVRSRSGYEDGHLVIDLDFNRD